MNYGNNLKLIRTAELWTQEKVADSLGIKRSTYKEYELQNSIIPLIHLNNFCNIFDISLDYIFNLSSNKKYRDTKESIDKKEVGKRLKEWRKEKHLTQEKLASLLNTTHSVISAYEKGKNLIATPFLYTICKNYNISADYLLGRISKNPF